VVTATIAFGQIPASVKIGNLAWTKQNINIETRNSWCYDNHKSNCAKYGRLYTWEAAKDVCQSTGGKWRLPTNKDWDNLMKAVVEAMEVDEDGDASFFMDAGKKLKSKSGWNGDDYEGKSGNGADEFGFSALPGGNRGSDGSFGNAGDNGLWWSATEYGSGSAYYWIMHYGGVYANKNTDGKSNGFSVRCVKD
jgi:uncharacterized protein (TIGR02145 family)